MKAGLLSTSARTACSVLSSVRGGQDSEAVSRTYTVILAAIPSGSAPGAGAAEMGEATENPPAALHMSAYSLD